MAQNNSTEQTHPTVNPVTEAEKAVNESIANFERSMEHLADRVEDTTVRVQEMIETAHKPIDGIIAIKDRVQEITTPILRDMQANKRSWAMTAAFIGAAFLLVKYLDRRQT